MARKVYLLSKSNECSNFVVGVFSNENWLRRDIMSAVRKSLEDIGYVFNEEDSDRNTFKFYKEDCEEDFEGFEITEMLLTPKGYYPGMLDIEGYI